MEYEVEYEGAASVLDGPAASPVRAREAAAR